MYVYYQLPVNRITYLLAPLLKICTYIPTIKMHLYDFMNMGNLCVNVNNMS